MKPALLLTLTLAFAATAADTPKRIVSLSPDLTEILYGVGAFPRIVGVSSYESYPPEAAKLPALGDLQRPNLEKLTALRPDLVLINVQQAPYFEDTLKQLGLRVLAAKNHSLAEVLESIIAIGHAVGNDTQAAKLAADTREGLDRVARKTASLPKPRVVLVVDRVPGTLRDLYTATSGSFLAELVELAGGHLVLPAGPRKATPNFRKEELLALDPDVILDFIQSTKGRLAGDPEEPWREMPELKAVRTHRVYGVNEDYVPHASQRIVQTAELFAKLIHPELAPH